MGQLIRNVSSGGVIRFINGKDADNKPVVKKTNSSLLKFDKIEINEIPSNLEDDGKPLENEFLKDVRMREEKQKLKEKLILQNHKEESYKSFVNGLLESSDDIFDSKGDDITKKDFLKNEMELD